MFSSVLAQSLHIPVQEIADPSQKKPARAEAFYKLRQLTGVTPASRLEMRPTPKMVSSGIREINELTGGFPCGCITQIYGAASSGRSGILLAALAASTRRREVCVLVDVNDALDPLSAAAAGVEFERLLWVRCGSPGSSSKHKRITLKKESPLAQALRATDLLLQSGGFGLIAIDLGDVPFRESRRIPLASWFRFQRAVEHTPTVLFVLSQEPLAQTCTALLLKVAGQTPSAFSSQLSGKSPSHARLLEHLEIKAEIVRSRVERRPVRSVTASFAATAVRTG